MREKPEAPVKPEEFECENCGCDISEDEFDENSGYCDECWYQGQENIKDGYR